MTNRQRIELRQLAVEAEQRAETWEADLEKLTKELRSLEPQLQAAILAEPEPEPRETRENSEEREIRELRERVDMGRYVRAALSLRSVDGAELEYNQHRGFEENQFPLELLAPEVRAARDGES